MSIPDFQSLMLPVLRRLMTGQASTGELIEVMAEEHGLTDEERHTLLPSGRQTTIANRTHWALAYLSRAGAVQRIARGRYEITERGRSILAAPPERITIAYLRRFPEFATSRTETDGTETAPQPALPDPALDLGRTPEERLEAADRDLRAELETMLLARLRKLDPAAFEQVIIDLLVRIGYGGSRRDAAERLGRSGDGGIDGVIREDVLGLDAVYIQAKRYAEDNTVGAPVIQGFAGALLEHGASKGVFVTTSRFTLAARKAGAAFRAHRIVLLDGSELARLMIEHDIGVRTVQTIKIQKIDLEAYEEEAA
ncbi:MAG: restriction endonuclease [Variovorax paradoxus]|uniref:Restriction endonuclease n=1 Tax=Variovorax paradoxus TaxID=34073 RepID=A0A2W5R6G0_VARPD|nr:MAG: restriction endonuclease [Variovorax paradoxus]